MLGAHRGVWLCWGTTGKPSPVLGRLLNTLVLVDDLSLVRSTQEAETEGSEIQGEPQLHSKLVPA